MGTTRLQQPKWIELNGEKYRIARDKKGARQWREVTVPVQPGGGEKQVTWESWHLGMGHSRYRTEYPHTYEYTIAGNCTTPWKATLGPAINSVTASSGHAFHRLIEYQSYIYALGVTTADNDIYALRLNSSAAIQTGSEKEIETSNSGPPGQPAVWENNLYIGVTGGGNLSFRVDTGDLDGYDIGAGTNAKHFCRVGRDMWGVDRSATGKISKVTSNVAWTWGTDDDALGTGTYWGALYSVGDTGQGINSLSEWGQWLYLGKPDGLFSGDAAGETWNQIPEVVLSSNNCLRLCRWEGMLLAPTINGLFRYSGLAARTVGPEVLFTNASTVRGGYFTALAHAGHWLYGAYKAHDGVNYLMTARLREADEMGTGQLVWHTLQSIGSTYTISDMLVSTVTTQPRLWWSYSAGANAHAIQNVILTDDGSLNVSDTNYSSAITTHAVYLPRIDLGSPGTPKTGHFVEVHTSGTLAAGKTVKVYAAWDGGSFNQVGSTITSSGFSRCYWTAGTNDTGRSLQIRIDITSDASDARPEVERVTVSLIESPRKEPAVDCKVVLGDMVDKKRTAVQMMSDIEGLESGSTYALIDPDDPAAGTLRCIVENHGFDDLEQEGEKQAQKVANLILRIVEYS